MLITDVQLFGVFVLLYLGMWFIAITRFMLCAYSSKGCSLYRAQRLASSARSIRKWGWLIFFCYPPLLLALPTVTVITQNPDYASGSAIELEGGKANISPEEEDLLRNSFHHKNYMALYFFNGERMPKGKYIFNNTDLTLHLYSSSFQENLPWSVDRANEGTDIPPRSLIKSYVTIDCFFDKPDPEVHHNKKEKNKIFTSIQTLDVKTLAQKQKKQIQQDIFNKRWHGPQKRELTFEPDGIDYSSSKSPNQDKILDPEKVMSNLKSAEKYIDSISRVQAEQVSSTYSRTRLSRAEFQKEMEQNRRQMDSVKRIFDKFDSLNKSQIPVTAPTTESERISDSGPKVKSGLETESDLTQAHSGQEPQE